MPIDSSCDGADDRGERSPECAPGRLSAADLTEEAGQRALRDHVVERALIARSKYGAPDYDVFLSLLDDREVVRYPTTLRFGNGALLPGEFAHAQALGESPRDGFVLHVHASLESAKEWVPWVGAYHLVTVNYGEIATHEEAELFGATLLGVDVDAYYARLCHIADGLSA